jgi:hypothetical protein
VSINNNNIKLKIGLLIDSYNLVLWEFILIKKLIESNYASVELVIVNTSIKPKKTFDKILFNKFKFLIFSLYNLFDQYFFKIEHDAFEKIDATSLLEKIKTINVEPIKSFSSDIINGKDNEQIKNNNLDVLIRFGFGILKGDILKAAKYGIWSYHHGDSKVNRGAPSCFWEVFENIDITGSTLQILSEELDAGRILFKSYSSTNKVSVHRNRNNSYWKSLSFLLRKLEELHSVGGEEFLRRVDKENQFPNFYSNKLNSVNNITNWIMTKYLFIHLFRLIKRKFSQFFFNDQWSLSYIIGKGLSKSFWQFKIIHPPKNSFFADPFIIKKHENYFIFIEEFDKTKSKGHISMIEMNPDGQYKSPIKIIDQQYHLSFPFIVESKDNYYLIPESRSNNTIEIYKCISFPTQWEYLTNLMEEIEAVDTVVFFYNNKWWLFTNIIENKGSSSLDELFLFYSDDLVSKKWTKHPKNPIVSDVRKSRSAGNIFIDNNVILRPSQDSSKRYGYGIKINEIKKLSETEYEEIEVDSIYPDWSRNIIATHTVNNVDDLTVIDGLIRSRFNLSFKWKRDSG